MTTRRRRATARRPFTLRNRSAYPTDEVRRIVRAAITAGPFDVSGVCMNVGNSRRAWGSGRAYFRIPDVSNAPPSAQYLVTIRLGDTYHFPRWHQGYDAPTVIEGEPGTPLPDEPFAHLKRWPLIALDDWEEALVYLVGHELKHIEQFKRMDALAEDDHHVRLSEIECDFAGFRTLRAVFPENRSMRLV